MAENAEAATLRAPRNLREAQQRATRKKLLLATRKAFSESGFQETTINDIVRIAGTSRATFYLHFSSKTEALAAAWDETQQPRMTRYWQRLDDAAPWTDEDVQKWITDMVVVWERSRKLSIASNEAVSIDPEMGRRWFAGINFFVQFVPNVVKRLARDSAHPEYRFLMLCTQMERSAYMYLTGNFPGTRKEFIATLTKFWRDALVD